VRALSKEDILVRRAATEEAFGRSRQSIPLIHNSLVEEGAAPEWLGLVDNILSAYNNASLAAQEWMRLYFDLLETTARQPAAEAIVNKRRGWGQGSHGG